ncbi:hypothetical protein Hanom_Chr17g01562991 [Helianthus anomalus]
MYVHLSILILLNSNKVVSSLVGLRENGFIAGQAARKPESKKVDKHAKACAENQHVFVHFAFDTFGSLTLEVIHFLTRVQRVIHGSCSASGGRVLFLVD